MHKCTYKHKNACTLTNLGGFNAALSRDLHVQHLSARAKLDL